MKAQILTTEKLASKAESLGRNYNRKICKYKRHIRTRDTQTYLDMLQELVPFMPKNERLPETEVITNVIDYICDLKDILGLPQPNDICNIQTEPQRTKISTNSELKNDKPNQMTKGLSGSNAHLPAASASTLQTLQLLSKTDLLSSNAS